MVASLLTRSHALTPAAELGGRGSLFCGPTDTFRVITPHFEQGVLRFGPSPRLVRLACDAQITEEAVAIVSKRGSLQQGWLLNCARATTDDNLRFFNLMDRQRFSRRVVAVRLHAHETANSEPNAPRVYEHLRVMSVCFGEENVPHSKVPKVPAGHIASIVYSDC